MVRHLFFKYGFLDYFNLGLQVFPYGKNSALVMKGNPLKFIWSDDLWSGLDGD